MSERTINNPRAEIDEIDGELLRLLNKRAEIALRVGAAKTSVETSLCDPNREREVLSRLRQENTGPFDEHSIDNIFQRIIDESLLLQQKTYLKPFENSDTPQNRSRETERENRASLFSVIAEPLARKRLSGFSATNASRFRFRLSKICLPRSTPERLI